MTQASPLVLTAADVAAAAGGRLVAGAAGSPVTGFSIDSRTIAPGDLFFAIRGERFDGHAFVRQALERGACGAVVSVPPGDPAAGAAVPVIVAVDDVVGALQRLARHVRRRSGARVVAITGSAGKTTTKEIAAELLAARYRVFRNRGNLNNHIGLPLSLLELRHRPEIAVVELGMSHAGEIRTLVGVAEPEIRVWTNVGDAHAAFFASTDAVADAKAEILEGAGPGDLLVANANDQRVMSRARPFAGRLLTFGIGVDAAVSASGVRELGLAGTEAEVRTPAGRVRLQVPLLGLGHLANVLAATAVALEAGVPLAAIAERVGRLRPPDHRGEVLRLPGGLTVIDDAYNSSPAALDRMLAVVGRAGDCARKVAVLGEMLELGDRAVALHEAGGRMAAAAGLRWLVTVGGAPARALGAAAVAAGMPADAVRHADDSAAAADLAATLVRAGDLVLVKGSRAVGTDRVVDRLKAEYA